MIVQIGDLRRHKAGKCNMVNTLKGENVNYYFFYLGLFLGDLLGFKFWVCSLPAIWPKKLFFQGSISPAARPVSSIVSWMITAISVASIERSIFVATIATTIAGRDTHTH